MSQIRYHNYARSLVSFDENLRVLGLIQSGRICGFDAMSVVGGNTLRINHTVSGFVGTDASGAAMAQRGVFQTRQGVIIHEDAAIDINVDFNSGNGSERVDTLIVSHSNIQSPGGAIATYSIIKGPTATGFPYRGPAVSNPLTQIALGNFIIAANATDHTLTTFEPISTRGPGGAAMIEKASDLNLKDMSGGYQKGDFNRLNKTGIHYFTSTLNRPTSSTANWFVIVMAQAAVITQIATASNSGKVYARSSANTGTTWSPWVNLNNPDVDASISALATAIGDQNYSANNYVADFTSITVAIGALDAALKVVADQIGPINTNISNLQTATGNQNYSSNVYVTDGTSLTTAIGALDAALSGLAGTVSALSSNKADKSIILTAGAGLLGTGDLSANRTFDINFDNATIEVISDILRVKALGILTAHLGDLQVTNGKLANNSVDGLKIINDAVTNGKILAGTINSDRLADKYTKSGDGVQLLTKVMNIGAWNMRVTGGGGAYSITTAAHGLTQSKIRALDLIIIRDDGERVDFGQSGAQGGSIQITSTDFQIGTGAGNDFDNTLYDDGVINRGILTITYEL